MKFYYNGKLIRTSKTHHYKFACINLETGNVLQCSETRSGATKLLTTIKAEKARAYENATSAIKAIDEGRTFYNAKIGRTSERVRIQRSKDQYLADMQDLRAWFDWSVLVHAVVELEERP